MPQLCYPEALHPTTSKSTSYTPHPHYDAPNLPEEDKCARCSGVCEDVRHQGVPGGAIIPELPEGVPKEKRTPVNIPAPTFFAMLGRRMYEDGVSYITSEGEGITARVLFRESQPEITGECCGWGLWFYIYIQMCKMCFYMH